MAEAGPSGIKKRKIIKVKNERKLTVEEMMEFLYNSDIDNEEFDDTDDCK